MLKRMGKKIKLLREKQGLTQQDLVEATDYTNASTITRIENGELAIPVTKLASIAEALDTTPAALLDYPAPAGAVPIEMTKNLRPVYEEIVAGVPIEAQTDVVDYVAVNSPHPDRYFGVRVVGDSMIDAGITDGCTAIIRSQQNADSGQIVAACINGETTLKKYTRIGDTIILMPANSNFDPIVVAENDEFSIYGVLVQIRKDFA